MRAYELGELFPFVEDHCVSGVDESTASFNLRDEVCERLKQANFFKPKPLQTKALPLLLEARDVYVQAKAGSGKSALLAILSSEIIRTSTLTPQVMIVVGSRESAQRLCHLFERVLSLDFKIGCFVGGSMFKADVDILKDKVQVAIGTCGRLRQLIENRSLKLHNLQLFALDDAERLDFDSVDDINFFISSLAPEIRQICVFSTSYPNNLQKIVKDYMRSPTLLRLDFLNDVPPLEYVVFCEKKMKSEVLWDLLCHLTFQQCSIFCDTASLATDVYNYLVEEEDSCVLFTKNSNQRDQLEKFRSLQAKILVTTNESAAGFTFPGCDLIFNIRLNDSEEIGGDSEGRFKSTAVTITLLGNDKEAGLMYRKVKQNKMEVKVLSEEKLPPKDLIGDWGYFDHFCISFMDHPLINNNEPVDPVNCTRSFTNTRTEANRNAFQVNLEPEFDDDEPVKTKPMSSYSSDEMIKILDSHDNAFYSSLLPQLEWRSNNNTVLWAEVLKSGPPANSRVVRNIDAVYEPERYVNSIVDCIREAHLKPQKTDQYQHQLVDELAQQVDLIDFDSSPRTTTNRAAADIPNDYSWFADYR
ncbi:hypothetical protein M3Y94_00936700 [Aphelenchoides besseyi]|nr:hypothetical protein M3Y94_00936700 [Aphelenchoides besseyi]KAI6224942.1 hypothetical protein M3Y95_00805600 [Aphelenchoides besseyi]